MPKLCLEYCGLFFSWTRCRRVNWPEISVNFRMKSRCLDATSSLWLSANYKHTYKYRDRQTDRQTDREYHDHINHLKQFTYASYGQLVPTVLPTFKDTSTDGRTDRPTNRRMDRRTDTDRQTDRWADQQIDRRGERQTDRHTSICCCSSANDRLMVSIVFCWGSTLDLSFFLRNSEPYTPTSNLRLVKEKGKERRFIERIVAYAVRPVVRRSSRL